MLSSAPLTAWVAGASGLVGRQLLTELARDERYVRVVALVRRPFDVGSAKVECRVVDFDRLEAADLGSVDDAYCALGTTIKQAGSQKAFYRVDFDYCAAFAKHALAHGARRLCLVTAGSANAGSGIFYLRVKGELEAAMRALGFEATHIFRPAFLVGERAEFRAGERLMQRLFGLLNPVLPARMRSVPASAVARAMIAATKSDERGFHVHESDAIQVYVKPF